MVKVIDAITKKLTDIQFKRIDSGEATEIEKADYNFWEKFVEDHPKFSKFVHDNRDAIDIVFDILLTVGVAKLAYNIGQVNLAKDFADWKTLGIGGVVDGKTLQIQSLVTTPKGLTGTVATSTTNPADMMDIIHKATEALANNGVEITTL